MKYLLSVLALIVLVGAIFSPSSAWAQSDCVNTEVSFLSGSVIGPVNVIDQAITPVISLEESTYSANNVINEINQNLCPARS